MKTKQNSNNNKTSRRRKKNVWKLWALLRKQTHKELVPLLLLEEQAQVASKRLELITKYRANTLMLLLFCTVSGATIRQNFDFFCRSPTLQILPIIVYVSTYSSSYSIVYVS